jgi:hypothetical protein
VRESENKPTESSASQSSAAAKLDRSRDLLLDLTLRNRLLNFPQGNPEFDDPYDRVQKNLPLKADIGKIWEKLVNDETTVRILPADGNPEVFERIITGGDLASTADDEHLEKRLLKLFREHQTLQSSTGDSAFFITLGFLEWREAPPKQVRSLFAPLLLLHVRLVRKSSSGGRRPFVLEMDADQHSGNPSLQEKLKSEHNLLLPSNDDIQSPEAYFCEVENAVRSKPQWKVHRTAALGFFNFARYRLWLDLDARQWPPGCAPSDHPVVQDLVDQKWRGDSSPLPSEDEIASHQEEHDLPVVLEADGTQYAALMAANRGQSLVIIGPPGSGKSQTITNLIAVSLAEGKRVLFVAQKKAALEVVQRLLNDVGMSSFCLPLHSDHAKPIDVHRQLAMAGFAHDERSYHTRDNYTSRSLTKALNYTAARLGKHPDGHGESAVKLIQRACALRANAQELVGRVWEDGLLDIEIPQPAIDPAWIDDRCRCLREWSTLHSEAGDAWLGWKPRKLFAMDTQRVDSALRAVIEAIDEALTHFEPLPSGLRTATIEDLTLTLGAIGKLPLPQALVPTLVMQIWQAGPEQQGIYQLERQLADYHRQRNLGITVLASTTGDDKAGAQAVLLAVSSLLERLRPSTSIGDATQILGDLSALLNAINDLSADLSRYPDAFSALANGSSTKPTFGLLSDWAAIDDRNIPDLPTALHIGLARSISADPALAAKSLQFADQLAHMRKLRSNAAEAFPGLPEIDRGQRKQIAQALAALCQIGMGGIRLKDLPQLLESVRHHATATRRLLDDFESSKELADLVAPGRKIGEARVLASRPGDWTVDLLQPPPELSRAILHNLAEGHAAPDEIIHASAVCDEAIGNLNAAREILGQATVDANELPSVQVLSRLSQEGTGNSTSIDLARMTKLCRAASTLIDQSNLFFRVVAKALGQPVPATIDDFESLSELIAALQKMPKVKPGGLFDNISCSDEVIQVRGIMSNCLKVNDCRAGLADRVDFRDLPAREELSKLRQLIRSHQGSPFRWLNAGYRSARKSIKAFSLKPLGSDMMTVAMLEDLDTLFSAVDSVGSDSAIAAVLGSTYTGVTTSWENAIEFFDWAEPFFTRDRERPVPIKQLVSFRTKNGAKLDQAPRRIESIKKHLKLLDADPLWNALPLNQITTGETQTLAGLETILSQAATLFEAATSELLVLGCTAQTTVAKAVDAISHLSEARNLYRSLDSLQARIQIPLRSISSVSLRATGQWFKAGIKHLVPPAVLICLADQSISSVSSLINILTDCTRLEESTKAIAHAFRAESLDELLADHLARSMEVAAAIDHAIPPGHRETKNVLSLNELFSILQQLETCDEFIEVCRTWDSVLAEDSSRSDGERLRATANWVQTAITNRMPLALLAWCLLGETRPRVLWWRQLLSKAKVIEIDLGRLIQTGVVLSNETEAPVFLDDWREQSSKHYAILAANIDLLIKRSTDSRCVDDDKAIRFIRAAIVENACNSCPGSGCRDRLRGKYKHGEIGIGK